MAEQRTLDAERAAPQIVHEVANVFRSAGFDVRESLGTDNQFAVSGSLDSAAILLESVLSRPTTGPDGLIPLQALHDIIEPYAHSIIKRGFDKDEQDRRLHAVADWIEACFAARCSPVADAAGELPALDAEGQAEGSKASGVPMPDGWARAGKRITIVNFGGMLSNVICAGSDEYRKEASELLLATIADEISLARQSAPEGAPVEVTNPERAKWNTKQWYEHIGAWETPEGFISFGSVMAVRAMLLQFQRAMYPTLSYPTFQHPDDAAVDRFATAMKDKMAASRAKGRNGWDNEVLCSAARLQTMLVEHLTKGDPIDIGNFAMMLWNRGEPVAAPTSASAQPSSPEIPDNSNSSDFSSSSASAQPQGENDE